MPVSHSGSIHIFCNVTGRVVPKFGKECGAFETSETHSTHYNIPETLLKFVFFGSNSL